MRPLRASYDLPLQSSLEEGEGPRGLRGRGLDRNSSPLHTPMPNALPPSFPTFSSFLPYFLLLPHPPFYHPHPPLYHPHPPPTFPTLLLTYPTLPPPSTSSPLPSSPTPWLPRGYPWYKEVASNLPKKIFLRWFFLPLIHCFGGTLHETELETGDEPRCARDVSFILQVYISSILLYFCK